MSLFTRLRNAFLIWRRASHHPRTPAASRVLPLISLLYLILPFDFIPDLLPLLGQLDDLGIIILLCMIAFRMIPPDVKREARRQVIDIEPKG